MAAPRHPRGWRGRSQLLALLAAAAGAQVAGASAQAGALNATTAQRMVAAVDAAAAMATSSEQLAAMFSSLTEPHGGEEALEGHLRALAGTNEALRGLLVRLRSELGLLFTTGRSAGLRLVIYELAVLPRTQASALRLAVAGVPGWVRQCQAPGAEGRYRDFEALHAEHCALDVELRALGERIHPLRDLRAAADGRLAGLEERLGRRRGQRSGEEYELARYLGSSLFRWDLLRTKVAHHLALTFTEAKEEAAAADLSAAPGGLEAAERALASLEEQLTLAAGTHKRLAEQRAGLAKKLRSFLKAFLLSCDGAPSAGMSKRFRVLRSPRFGVKVQAAEELMRFLNGTFAHSLPQTVAVLEEVIAPYAVAGGEYALPTKWKAKPKIGRWREWLEDSGGVPVARAEFERRFAVAQRRFSVHVSAAEPVVIAYLLWLLLEDALGAASTDDGHAEVLALPGPAEANGSAAEGSANASALSPKVGAGLVEKEGKLFVL